MKLFKNFMRCLWSVICNRILMFVTPIQEAHDELLQVSFEDIGSDDIEGLLKSFNFDLNVWEMDKLTYSYEKEPPPSYTAKELYSYYKSFEIDFFFRTLLDQIEFNGIKIKDVGLQVDNYENKRYLELCFYRHTATFKDQNLGDEMDDTIFMELIHQPMLDIAKKFGARILYGGIDSIELYEWHSWFYHELSRK